MATHDQGAVGGNTAGDLAKVVVFFRQVFYMQRVFLMKFRHESQK